MKLPFLNIWITRVDWEDKRNSQIKFTRHWREKYFKENEMLNRLKSGQSETYTDKQGKLRYKHNGKFAPDNRTAFKKTHDELRAGVAERDVIDYTKAKDIWDAKKNEAFGR